MTKPILFYADLCPDTMPFKQELERLSVEYEDVNIFESMANFKRFLRLRDNHPVFDTPKSLGSIGIPALVLDDEKVILDREELQTIFG
ncbi:hypothetical protein QJU89_00810 [Pasteurella skyensis]|uniref:Glutaredoxin-related protein n=1 Tax=Phocoenobacter skyensis TaxID=97481 RepID=A0AAJ6NZR4_9PAST|nr:hypothetical protein [Pasteurella skyensis]MDP8161733.1 hypothetical protein [Pasteurella skyensis]MDP8171889.1 hypothetical protein [Pasteurella skyensis]MDP8176127.1 hypothetical protein [Pasteurella skyensis]MDP8178144.1 hypothetical protein [Pasteurella skyensis]MDP8182248.1 hypothetical protein [Pasteurella skyensis]